MMALSPHTNVYFHIMDFKKSYKVYGDVFECNKLHVI